MNRNCLFLYIIRVINFNFQEIEKSRYKQQCRIRFNIITLLCVVDGLHLIIRFNIITLLCVECLHLIIRFNIITLLCVECLHLIVRFNIITLLHVVDGLHLIIRFNIITLLCGGWFTPYNKV
jgi:hypothetical protein